MMSVKTQSLSPSEMTKNLVISKCDYFVDVQLWPLKNKLNPNLWLQNFKDDEMEFAVHLLNSFLYFSEDLIDKMFVAAFQNLSNKIRPNGVSLLEAQVTWESFVNQLIITPVSGEMPNISDSGFSFARKARQLLGIRESQLMDQAACLQAFVDNGPRPIIFVDDFVGSGEQFVKTWKRCIKLNHVDVTSYKDISSARGSAFYYCPLICTEEGYNRLRIECPEVTISPAHILSPRYSALNVDSVIWPEHLRTSAVHFLHAASMRAGIPDNNGGVNDWRGFYKRGLTIAFEHSIPDATMPIFYWEDNGWKPLIRRA